MSTHRRFLILSLLVSSITFQAVAQPPKREFRAAWVASVTNLDWPTSTTQGAAVQQADMKTLFDQLKANGITAVVFQVRPECDALYASPYEPWSYWLTGTQGLGPGYDPLALAVEEAHSRAMELHAWFNPYRAERSVGNYATAGNHVTKAHPEWILTFGTLKMLDPGLPAVREYDARVLADVVRRYDVDGIHMDDYFYPYSPKITVQDSASWRLYNRGFASIDDWRRDNVNLLLQMIRDSVRAIKPHVKFGMSPFGIWKSGTPPGIIGLSSYSEIFCDPIAWLQQGTVDYLTPQLYWKIGGNQDYQKLSAWWADSVGAHGRHFYPGEAAYHASDATYTAAEMPNQIKINRANPKTSGSVFFRARSGITDNPQGFGDSLKQTYYRYPALHPVMAWKETVPPYPPRGIRYALMPGTSTYAIQWDLPLTAPDGDSASRYAVYRFDHRPLLSELDDARNLVSVEGHRSSVPSLPSGSGTYYFVVTALDRNYNESDTSNILIIGPPLPPLLTFPSNGAVAVAESVQTRWRAVQGVTKYHLQVGTDSAFASGLNVNDSTLADTTKIARNLSGLATYWWRVRAGNISGWGAYSQVFTFMTGTPKAPVPLYPLSVTGLPITLTFVWTQAEGATSYRFQLATSADYAAVVTDTAGLADTTITVSGLALNRIHYWRVRGVNAVGQSVWSSSGVFRTYTGVEPTRDDGVPSEFMLSQNYPNPFNPTTSVQFALPKTEHVLVRVYDMLGQEVATLVEETLSAGRYTVTWNASHAASGVYFYRIVAGSFIDTKRMLLLK
jgi:uncharacterized lipoprotein YddW (UPF0748 family)